MAFDLRKLLGKIGSEAGHAIQAAAPLALGGAITGSKGIANAVKRQHQQPQQGATDQYGWGGSALNQAHILSKMPAMPQFQQAQMQAPQFQQQAPLWQQGNFGPQAIQFPRGTYGSSEDIRRSRLNEGAGMPYGDYTVQPQNPYQPY